MRLFEEGKRFPFWVGVLVAAVIWILIWGLDMEEIPVLDPDFVGEDIPLLPIADLRVPDQKKYFTIEPLN